MRGSHLLTCLVFILCLSSLAGCTGSTPSPTVMPASVVPSATPISTAIPTLIATATPVRKDRIPLWDSGYFSMVTTSCAVLGPISNRANSHDIVRYFV